MISPDHCSGRRPTPVPYQPAEQNFEISADIVAETGNIVAKNGNSVKATFEGLMKLGI